MVCSFASWKHSFTASLVIEILVGRWKGCYKRLEEDEKPKQRDENVRDIFIAFIPTMTIHRRVDVIVERD